MIQSLWTGASGLSAQQFKVDTIANNLANVNTVAFKRDAVRFSDALYSRMRPEERVTLRGRRVTAGYDRGHGVQILGTDRLYSQGTVEPSDQPTDLAIEGPGFLRVRLPDGGDALTRDGSLRVDGAGQLVTADGYPVLDSAGNPLAIPAGSHEIAIDSQGRVTAFVAHEGDSRHQEVGQIGLVAPEDTSALRPMGRNLYRLEPGAGSADAYEAGARLRQGALERSNVDLAQEMVELITAQRAYELASRAVRTADEMMALANSLRR